MQQRGSSHHAGKDALNSVHADMRIDVRYGAIGQNEAYVESHKRTAPSKHETHESADVAVFLNPIAVIDPHKRQVLHVVKNFEQGNSNENVRYEIIAVPPKRDARDQQSYLHRIRPFSDYPKPTEMRDKQAGNGDGQEQNQALAKLHHRWQIGRAHV